MPLLKDRLSTTDTTIQNTVQDVNNILSVNEIINLNILDLIVGNINIPSGSLFVIDKPLSTATLVNKYGQGTLWLSASYANLTPGTIKIYEGELIINNSNTALDGTIEISTKNNASLKIKNNSTNPFTNTINYATPPVGTPSDPIITFATSSVPTPLHIPDSLWIAGSVIIDPGQRVLVPKIGQYSPSSVIVNGILQFTTLTPVPLPSMTIDYTISGVGQIFFWCSTTPVTITSMNTYTGGTEIQEGTVIAGSSLSFGLGPIRLYSGATLDLNNQAISNTIYTEGGIILNDSNYTGQIYYV
jgi:autotransporter-associated beta strand protein